MTNWLRVLSNLLPRGRAWKLWPGSTIRAFFTGLIDGLIKPAREQFDRIFLDLFPQTTRELEAWELQWGLRPGSLTEQERRDRLDARWKALGGQSPRYIQDTLQGAGFDVYVHEWWEPATNPPDPRNPLLVLGDGSEVVTSLAGEPFMQCGEPDALCGFLEVRPGYPLVNKISRSVRRYSSVAGASYMVAGNSRAVAGTLSGFIIQPKQYQIPQDVDAWPYFLYIGGETFPDVAQVPAARRDEFEELMLKICPAQQWLGVLVEYV